MRNKVGLGDLRRHAGTAPRNRKKLEHRLTVLMLYGILVFVFQYGSRRAANAEITRPMFEHNLRLLFPQLESLPQSDTLFRLLCRIDVGHTNAKKFIDMYVVPSMPLFTRRWPRYPRVRRVSAAGNIFVRRH